VSSEVFILAFPKLRISHVEAAQTISKTPHDALFLMFSRNLEEPVKILAEGFPYDYVINEIKKQKLIPEPFGAWEYFAEPILKILSKIKQKNPKLNIYCYGSPIYENVSTETATKIATLTLKALATGKINVKEWKKVLLEEIKFSLDATEEEAEFVLSIVKNYKKSLCVSGLQGKNLEEKIRLEKNMNVKLEYLGVPYYLTPLEALKKELLNELEGKPSSDEKMEKLIKYHLRYIKKYILLSKSLDDAYFRWVMEEAKNLENIFGKQQIVFTG